jgi:hypothetical protein
VRNTAPVTDLGPWQRVEVTHRLSWFANEGLATVHAPGGGTQLVHRGTLSIPLRLRRAGWSHIGDPGSHDGYLFDCYQGPAGATSKLFEVRAPDGTPQDFEHPLAPGEMLNNSFVAVAPDGQWMVAGEWQEMSRLLVFPTPLLNPAAGADPRKLALSGTLELDRPVRNMQGATFLSPTTLLCSTDDPGTDLWPSARQVLQLTLPHPLDGSTMTAAVSYVGPVPLQSGCRGTFETEGIDYDEDGGDLRLAVIPPGLCGVGTAIYRFRHV